MARGYMSSSASGRACCCKQKDKTNWFIIGKTGKKKTIECIKCRSQWDTNAKYVEDLKKM